MPNPGEFEAKGLSEISEIMTGDVKTIEADATLQKAGRVMAEYSVGSLLVVKKGQYVGILTDTDLARKGMARGANPEKEQVQSFMSSPILSIESHKLVEEAQAFMKAKKIRHLAVTEEGKIVGIVSLGDLVRYYAAFFMTSE
ncbi:MAG: CBS domain-containing protein [Nitrospirae bacterium]|nr:CBS domain-containing protein [Nitrospirota bacterium]